ncbi:MAG TPA: hypothetical protein VMF66_15330 [Candidatus Acidoferrum sp.]|nr:hypothetical protein [Candidatus Acidoferrum sp.]
MNQTKSFPFRWVLPGAQLLICIALLWPWRGAYLLAFQAEGHALWPTRINQPGFYLRTVPAGKGENTDSTIWVDFRLNAPALLNMPAGFVGFVRVHPAAVPPIAWRALSWPIIGIVFWWMAGRAIEALLASRSGGLSPPIRWPEVILAGWVAALGIALCVSLLVSPDFRPDFIFPWRGAALASGGWAVLSALTLIARIAQWRIRRRAFGQRA